MNATNAFGTITAVLTLLIGVMTQLLGCSAASDGISATCTSTILPASYMVWAAMAFGILTLVLKLIRPGGPLRSLFGSTAVVVPENKAGPGTVSPSQVAAL